MGGAAFSDTAIRAGFKPIVQRRQWVGHCAVRCKAPKSQTTRYLNGAYIFRRNDIFPRLSTRANEVIQTHG